MPTWPPSSALVALGPLDTSPETGGTATVRLEEMPSRPTLLVIARKDMAKATVKRTSESLGLELPASPARAIAARAEAVWSGPGQWLVMCEPPDAAERLAKLRHDLAGIASVSEQTDARVILRLSGAGARRTLMKIVGIDVHDRAFLPGAAAMTPVAHIPAHLWRLADADAAPAYEIAAPRSSIASLWHAIVAAASELGLEARPAQAAAAK